MSKKSLLDRLWKILTFRIEELGDVELASPRVFKTGSVGYSVSKKVLTKTPDGQSVTLNVGVNVTVNGSKELPYH